MRSSHESYLRPGVAPHSAKSFVYGSVFGPAAAPDKHKSGSMRSGSGGLFRFPPRSLGLCGRGCSPLLRRGFEFFLRGDSFARPLLRSFQCRPGRCNLLHCGGGGCSNSPFLRLLVASDGLETRRGSGSYCDVLLPCQVSCSGDLRLGRRRCR